MEKSPIATSDPAVPVVVISVVRITTVEAISVVRTTTAEAAATTTVRSPRTAAADPLFPFSAAVPIKK